MTTSGRVTDAVDSARREVATKNGRTIGSTILLGVTIFPTLFYRLLRAACRRRKPSKGVDGELEGFADEK